MLRTKQLQKKIIQYDNTVTTCPYSALKKLKIATDPICSLSPGSSLFYLLVEATRITILSYFEIEL